MPSMNTKGSTLILALIAMLVLSLIGLSALTQSSTEIGTTRNFFMDKSAFYTADAGIQVGINEIRKASLDPSSVHFTRPLGKYNFYTGTIADGTEKPVQGFLGFKPPQPVGMSIEMSGELNVAHLPWNLTIAVNAATGTRNQIRKEVRTVVVTMATEY